MTVLDSDWRPRILWIRHDCIAKYQPKSSRRSFDSAPHPSDEDLSLGTPVRSAQDDSVLVLQSFHADQ